MSSERIDRFITYLLSLEASQDRAALAWLRRGLGRTMADAPEAARFVYPFFSGAETELRFLEDAFFRVATLFALHPENTETGNLGHHLRAAHRQGETEDPGKERRLLQLLAADRNDLDDLLRQAITLLQAEQVAVNWRQLLTDFIYWGDGVKRAWARSYWRTQATPANEPVAETVRTDID